LLDTIQKKRLQTGLVLRLSREPERPHVNWTTDTVDNENMGKKKSKCCCIYKKKKTCDDSECETGSCRGHVEKKKHGHDHPAGGGDVVS
uniref:E3 ubiquitin-protein ligase PPP1R11 n=1 Tax=Angiostrongylus cantonensis TaxID=6313 RepID=A0A0K0D200_ANGCA